MIGTAAKLRFGLSGAELVRLVALRRVGIEEGQLIIVDETPTGDVLLDEALASMRDSLTAKGWVGKRGDATRRYLERLAGAGTIRAERRKVLGMVPVTGWRVLDAGRLAEARARLDAIAHGSGGVDSEQAALAGLASAIGLPSLVYPGWAGRAARKRVGEAGRAALDAGTRAAASVAADAATRAATDAAVQASIDAATHTAQHIAGDAGHAGGGHH